jgi:hypothetical protein
MSRSMIGLVEVGCVLGCVLGCSASVRAPAAAPGARAPAAVTPSSVLPIRKIRFYQSGIAQFERAGQISAGATSLPLPTSHLDDALKTLVVYRDGVPVPAFSASFDGVMMEKNARALAKLPLDMQKAVGYPDLLESLKGEAVELWVGKRRVQGRLVQVNKLDPKPVDPHAESSEPGGKAEPARPEMPEYELTVLTDGAAIERCSSKDVARIRPLDPMVAARLETAIKAASEHADQVLRTMSILGAIGKNARLSYVTEAPVWRTTYRADLDPKGGAASLHGLALVHNDTEEPWTSVDIDLSNAEPDSVLFPLAAPRYWGRQLGITPENGADVVAPLTMQSPDELADAAPPDGSRSGHNRNNARLHGQLRAASPVRSSSVTALPTQQPVNIASGRSGYAYHVATPVTLPPRSSSLLPFLDARVRVERGVWFFDRNSAGRSVVRLENATSNPLPPGTMSLFDRERFLGEVEIPQIEPARSGYFDFGAELGMEIKQMPAPAPTSKYRAVLWKDDAFTIRVADHEERPIEVNNIGSEDRVAFIALPTQEKPKLQGADRVELPDGTDRAIAIIRVAGHQRVARTLVLDQERTETPDIDSLEGSVLDDLIREDWLSTASRAALREARTAIQAKTALSARKDRAEQDVAKIEESIERLGVGNNSEQPTAPPIAARFVQLEAQRIQTQKLVSQLEKEIEKKSESVALALKKLPKE